MFSLEQQQKAFCLCFLKRPHIILTVSICNNVCKCVCVPTASVAYAWMAETALWAMIGGH